MNSLNQYFGVKPMKLFSYLSMAKTLLKVNFFKIKIPLAVSWALTYKCNLSCEYCGLWRKGGVDLSTKQVCRVLDEMQEAKVKYISFTGGEPLIRDDIGVIVNYAKLKGISVNLNTNGTLLLNKFEEIKNVDSIQVSLDGDELINDEARGGGVYKTVIEALNFLKNKNIKFRIQTVISCFNRDCIDYICELSKRLSVPISFQPATEKLLGSQLDNPCIPEILRYADSIKNIIIKKQQGYNIFNSFAGLKHLSYFPSKKKMKCMAGLLCCDVEPDGKIFACDRYPYHRQYGDILKTGFQNAFNSLRPVSCEHCWCASQVEFNYIASFNINSILNMLNNNYL